MLAKKSKTKIAETETFGSLERVVPISEESALNVYDTLTSLRKLYFGIAAIKNKETINSSNFEKLSQKRLLLALNFSTFEMSLLF